MPTHELIGRVIDNAGHEATGSVFINISEVQSFDFFVSPNGLASNPGSFEQPWSAAHALLGAGGMIRPGHRIAFRGGVYFRATGSWIWTINIGTESNPIRWHNYPGELVEFVSGDPSGLEVCVNRGSHNWFIGELGGNVGFSMHRGQNFDRSFDNQTNFWNASLPSTGTRFVHIISHDGAGGFSNGSSSSEDSGDTQYYGNIMYNCGDELRTGTGAYIKHDSAARRMIFARNVCFNNMAYGLHFFSNTKSNSARNADIYENILFNAGIISDGGGSRRNCLIGGNGNDSPLRSVTCWGNVLYHSTNRTSDGQFFLGSSVPLNEELDFHDNYVVGGGNDMAYIENFVQNGIGFKFYRNTFIARAPMRLIRLLDSSYAYGRWENNVWQGRLANASAWQHGSHSAESFLNWKTHTGLGTTDVVVEILPVETKTFLVRLDDYLDNHRCFCGFFNWGNNILVPIDLSSVLNIGDFFEIYNIQAIKGTPVVGRTQYTGSMVQLPTNGVTPPAPIGTVPTAPISTAPFFDVFFVKRVV